jgi:hypothetical protein
MQLHSKWRCRSERTREEPQTERENENRRRTTERGRYGERKRTREEPQAERENERRTTAREEVTEIITKFYQFKKKSFN